jgi:hypothetical protein
VQRQTTSIALPLAASEINFLHALCTIGNLPQESGPDLPRRRGGYNRVVLASLQEIRRMSDVTRILLQIETGDPSAAEKLLPLVYDELRKLAGAPLALEKPLDATVLVPWTSYCKRTNPKSPRRVTATTELSLAR